MRHAVHLEPEVLASIRRHSRGKWIVRGAAAAPLLLGVLVALAILISRAARPGALPEVNPLLWVLLLVVAAVPAVLIPMVKPERPPIVPHPDPAGLEVFRDALEGVSLAVGAEVPPVSALDLPTVNSISLLSGGKPSVGVTADALAAALPARHAEAMMAHELAHVVLEDVVVGSSWGRVALMFLILEATVLLPFVLLALAFGFGTWIYPCMGAWMLFTLALVGLLGPRMYRQNDLLADSIAAKITGDPEALKDAIIEARGIFNASAEPFPPLSRYKELLFVYEVRPEVDYKALSEWNNEPGDVPPDPEEVESELRWVRKRGAFPRVSIDRRIENLEAIERGSWPQFEH
ncbi:MAG: M48 family metalloprotease [Actinomycetota bacterium]